MLNTEQPSTMLQYEVHFILIELIPTWLLTDRKLIFLAFDMSSSINGFTIGILTRDFLNKKENFGGHLVLPSMKAMRWHNIY